MDPLRILLVDDHRAFSGALAKLLDAQPDLQVVAAVPTSTAARAAAATLTPDVAIVDIDLAGGSGVELIGELRSLPSKPPQIVVLTCHDDVDTAEAAIRAGALAFVPKDEPSDELVRAVRGAATGEAQIPGRLLTAVMQRLSARPAGPSPEARLVSRLTAREREVLECMMGGLDRRAIARRLVLSPNTVRTHARNILAKLDVHSTLEAVSLGYRAGLSPRRDPPPDHG